MTSIAAERVRRLRIGRLGLSALFVGIAIVLAPAADFQIAGHDPWAELARMGAGLLHPDFSALGALSYAAALTIAFAICGVALGAAAGFAMAPFYDRWPIRMVCIAIRAVHELFWALMLMQIVGLSATTGILAIAIPYAGIFAKVFSEYLDEADPRPAAAMPVRADTVSVHFYARLPLAARSAGPTLCTGWNADCGPARSSVSSACRHSASSSTPFSVRAFMARSRRS